ncbi:hypothetical protein CN918_28785 [Priestia megaterium]|nr:hypothetical protein CN918_28785 [Priestia megaterium]
MKEIEMNDLEKRINQRRKDVNEKLYKERPDIRVQRTRIRNADEQKALTEICRARWQRAVKKGKIKKLGPREWFYDFSED